ALVGMERIGLVVARRADGMIVHHHIGAVIRPSRQNRRRHVLADGDASVLGLAVGHVGERIRQRAVEHRLLARVELDQGIMGGLGGGGVDRGVFGVGGVGGGGGVLAVGG